MRVRTRCLCLCVFVVFFASCGKETPAPQTLDLLSDLGLVDQVWDTGCIDVAGDDAGRSGSIKKAVDGSAYTWMRGRNQILYFKSLTSSDKQVKIRCRAAIPQTISPVINGRTLKGEWVRKDWGEYAFGIPNDLLHTGENSLTFFAESGKLNLAISSVCFSPGSQSPEAQFDVAKSGESRVIAATPTGLMSVYLKIPEDAVILVEYGLFSNDTPRGSGATFTVYLEDERNQRTVLAAETLRKGFFSQSKGSTTIDLKPHAGRISRIAFETSQAWDVPTPKRVYWGKALLSAPAPRGATPVAVRSRESAGKVPVFIYVVDALRSDRLEPYGYKLPTSPRLKEFVKDAVVFERAYAQTSWTRTSVASILTGRYPSSHLVEERMDVFPDFLPSLQKVLRSQGYAGCGFVANPNIGPHFNFHSNFDEYHCWEEHHSDEFVRFVESRFSELDRKDKKPVFAYFQPIDPHAPYDPGSRAAGTLPNCTLKLEGVLRPVAFKVDESENPEVQKQYVRCAATLYDREVYISDLGFGRFLDLLKAHGLYEDAIIFFTADHGESFQEHGTWGHGKTLYEAEIRVPLIVKFPHNHFAGERMTSPVRHIDIYPTVLDALSVEIPDGVQGESLLRLMEQDASQDPLIFSELKLAGKNRKSVVYGCHKLIANKSLSEPHPDVEFYNVCADPGERVDLSIKIPVMSGYLRSEMIRWTRDQEKLAATMTKPKEAVIDKETEENLRALGYVQ